MTPDFTFDAKNGELRRADRIVMLQPHQREIISLLTAVPLGERVPVASFMDKMRRAQFEVAADIGVLRSRLIRIGITIEGKRGEGYRLIVHEMPKKWQPTMAPPVQLEDFKT